MNSFPSFSFLSAELVEYSSEMLDTRNVIFAVSLVEALTLVSLEDGTKLCFRCVQSNLQVRHIVRPAFNVVNEPSFRICAFESMKGLTQSSMLDL